MDFQDTGYWALVLGGSSGFGLAAAKRLALAGMNLCVVHRDRRGAMGPIEEAFQSLRAMGSKVCTFNADATGAVECARILAELRPQMGDGRIRLLLHSIAHGSLKPLAPARPGDQFSDAAYLDDDEIARTVSAMGLTLLTWTREIFKRGMFAEDARVLGLTSEGSAVAWPGYAAVSAAKAALESLSRCIAREFAPHGIRCNIVQPGVSDTNALRHIPGSGEMIANAIARNPFGRLTTPDDVAKIITLLCTDAAAWINGAVIRADGGEAICGT